MNTPKTVVSVRSQRSRTEAARRMPGVSGREPARAFASLGYEIVRQRGSHLRLRHPANTRQPLAVPDHAEPKTGLLRALIRDAGTSVEEFVEALRR